MDTSIFCFATDLADEGVETVLDNLQPRAGLGGITVAAAYHDGPRRLPPQPGAQGALPRRRRGLLRARPGARAVRLQPPVSEAAHVLPALVDAAGRRGFAVRAWTVFLHNGALAEAHPDCAPENAFGDRYLTDLCPAHPDVRAYARALAADVARLGVATICSESLHYHGLEHGYAHERYFVPLGPRARYLLGLCFCEHCLAAARSAGWTARPFAARPRRDRARLRPATEPAGEPERGEYERVREQIVTSLVAEVAEAAGAHAARVSWSSRARSRATPTAVPRATLRLRSRGSSGVDVDPVARACDGIEAIGYAADPERVRSRPRRPTATPRCP